MTAWNPVTCELNSEFRVHFTGARSQPALVLQTIRRKKDLCGYISVLPSSATEMIFYSLTVFLGNNHVDLSMLDTNYSALFC